jgi:hypothetical protein
MCNGEFLWIARETAYGTSWMIDQGPATLMAAVDRVPPAMAEWVIDQTIAALGEGIAQMAGLEVSCEGNVNARNVEPSGREEHFAEFAGLMTEFMEFAHVANVVVEKLESLYELVERERREEVDDGRAVA